VSSTVITVVILAALGFYLVTLYNRLVSLRNRHANAFSQIDVQLQRRYELIPNLVAIAKEYMAHEKETVTQGINARNTADGARQAASANPENAGRVHALADAESVLGSAMGRFNMVMEDYPDLKADERMADLHRDLTSTENRVGFARQAYSDAGMEYNTECEKFPAVLVARMFAFQKADLFEIDSPEAREKVTVSFA